MALKTFFILSAFLSLRLSNTVWISGPSGVNAAPMPTLGLQTAKLMVQRLPHLKPDLSRLPPLEKLSEKDIDSFKPFTNYAGAAYCTGEEIKEWKCTACSEANPNFRVVEWKKEDASGQFWYVGVDPQLKSVIVAHQGTDIQKLGAIRADLTVIPRIKLRNGWAGLQSAKTIRVHKGFLNAHLRTQDAIQEAIEKAMALLLELDPDALPNVTVVGHSLGGAIALLSGIWISGANRSYKVKVVTYGQPRVGNKAFSQSVDGLKTDPNRPFESIRIVNRKDIVSIVPGRGFIPSIVPGTISWTHTSGEIHILSNGDWVKCEGSDNDDPRCSAGSIKFWISLGSVKDHSGPYGDVYMRCNTKDKEMKKGPGVEEVNLDLDAEPTDLVPLEYGLALGAPWT